MSVAHPSPLPRAAAPAMVAARWAALPVRIARELLIRFGLIVALFALWELALHGQDSFQFKPPSAIFAKMHEVWFSGPVTSLFLTAAFWNDVVPSIARALGGWMLGGLVGVAVGIAAGRSLWARGYIDPVVNYLRSIPKAALVPTFLIVFGANDVTRVVAIAVSTVWLVLLNTMQGVRALDPVMRDTGRAFRIPAWKQLTHIVIPAASPKIIAGLRVTLSLSLIVMLVSEWLLTDSGLGYYLIDRQRNYDITEMWAAFLLLACIGYGLNTAFVMIERRLLRWHDAAHGREAH
jgi:ABC-type nitrate/sulfonate/bicarbonate transport system permease component